jgi:hypothetical protein
MSEDGLLCRCAVCQREERAAPSPLTNGWPKCCGYTMTLIDTERFITSIDESMSEAFAPARKLIDHYDPVGDGYDPGSFERVADEQARWGR